MPGKIKFVPINPRDPYAPRFARSLDETRRDAYNWWEADVPKVASRVPYRGGPPKINAPSGFAARLQQSLLAKRPPPFFESALELLARWLGFAVALAHAPLRRTVIDEANPIEYTAPRFKSIVFPLSHPESKT